MDKGARGARAAAHAFEVKFYAAGQLPAGIRGSLRDLVDENMTGYPSFEVVGDSNHLASDDMLFFTCGGHGTLPLLGFAAFKLEVVEDTTLVVYIYELQVRAGVQGQGLGSRLLLYVEQWSAEQHERQPRALMLTVHRSNARARKFYWKSGFKKSMLSPGYKAAYRILEKELRHGQKTKQRAGVV